MGENAGKEAKISSSSSSLIHGAGAWAVKKTSYWLMQERNEQDAKCVFECLNSIKRSRSKFFSSAIRLLTCLMICRGVCYLLTQRVHWRNNQQVSSLFCHNITLHFTQSSPPTNEHRRRRTFPSSTSSTAYFKVCECLKSAVNVKLTQTCNIPWCHNIFVAFDAKAVVMCDEFASDFSQLIDPLIIRRQINQF